MMWSINGVLTGLLTATVGGATVLATLLYMYPWLKYDYLYIRKFLKALVVLGWKRKNLKLIDIFQNKVRETPKKTLLLFQDEKYTYEEIDKRSNKVANLGLKLGLKPGDVVAIMILNEPAFIWTYFGLMKIGVTVSFLNTNIRSKSLLHCFSLCDAKVLIVGKGNDLTEAISEIKGELDAQSVKTYVQGNNNPPKGFESFDDIYENASDDPIDRAIRKDIEFQGPAVYIYTSGTTGLPKAAVVTHVKTLKGGALTMICDTIKDDVFYTPLPLYHSAGGLIALGGVVVVGGTLALRNKFSASQFWNDCRKYDVTVIQYIGELCRYLVARPKTPDDANHKIRIAIGNGLRRDVWNEFSERFKIPLIGEFYAATEGNGGMMNVLGKPGSIGRSSPFLRILSPLYTIEYDMENDEPRRTKAGLCKMAPMEVPGLAVMPIKRNFEFDGYVGNKELTEKKILRDVFKKGDVFFNSGDLIVFDKEYFAYFSDRVGDTFRWKGENVSTTEVANVVSDLPWIEDANVYGVEVAGQDGRAGMAAISLSEGHELSAEKLAQLYKHCEELLPVYANPKFLRLLEKVEITATFKQKKVELRNQGCDPAKCGGEALYVVDTKNKTFIPITPDIYQQISDGVFRL